MAATIETLVDELERSYAEAQERMNDPALYADRHAAAEAGRRVEVEIFGDWIPGEIAEEPLWDPAGERIRA